MKKSIIAIIVSFACVSGLLAQTYGIEINGLKVVNAEAAGVYEGFDQFLAHVQLSDGDVCRLINTTTCDKWMVDLNSYSVNAFTGGKSAGQITCTKAGCYDFYIKLKWGEDELYIGEGSNCSTGEESSCTAAVTDVYLTGDGTWTGGEEWNPAAVKLTNNTISFSQLPAGSYKFKITNGTWDRAWGYSAVDAACSTQGYTGDNDGNVVFSISGAADVTISFTDAQRICLTASCCMQESYGSAVPSACEDVLLQGFYYDSYKDNDAERGTDKYGNTRWKTLLGQAGEIGAYFDLIWLPPSGYASGTGYHPRQYSNQNSDWGSRADLEKLIAEFHNSGTKVVADMVVNHLEAMTSWCDFAVQDFGPYGKFEPDGSYICSTDEMNNPGTKAEAGDCWGTATGPADDGPDYDGKNESNYGAARDLAHDSEKVREMCRAYAKWLINEMHYDGFRYDYCKGFHASHIGDYNKAGGAYISFMELWASVGAIQQAINDAQGNTMSLDFPGKYDAFNNGICSGNYNGCKGSGLLGAGMSKYAVTFVDNHDTFLRDNNEFGGLGNSMKPELKDKLLQANAFMLSMPGVPCVFYPHWVAHKEAIKAMINARHLAGVHSESAVSDESASKNGYQCTITGKHGFLVLQLGNKATTTPWDNNLKLAASGNGYSIWVNCSGDVAPGLIVTESTTFEDKEGGIDVTIEAVGGSGNATIYYTTDGTEPTTSSSVYSTPLNFKETTTLKVMGVCGNAKSKVQTYTYTYREPLERGIRVRFNKPAEWDKVYFYAWLPGVDEQGNPTSSNLMGAYPGRRIYEDAEGWFSYEFDASLKNVHFCINSGDDCGGVNVRSNDLIADYDVCYGWREGKETAASEEVLLECDTELNPDFDMVISPESGFFRDLEEGMDITLTAVGAENAMIYYSIDGSTPTTASLSAQGSITFNVKQTTTVQAFAVLDQVTTPIYTETYQYKAPQEGAITVKYMKPEEWENLYLYAFTRVKVGGTYKDTAYPLDGKESNTHWPGMKWTTKDGDWYTYTLADDVKEIYVIFTEGNQKPQTQDIFLTENTCYVWNADCYRAVVSPNCDGKIDDSAVENTVQQGEDELDLSQPIYNVLGIRVSADYRGVVIQNGKKYIRL